MSSLQKPRKVTVRGNDGKSYSFLCKPKDDLRKDARLMEFNAMIIKLLKKDSDARSRKLGASVPASLSQAALTLLLSRHPHILGCSAQRGVRLDRMGSARRRSPKRAQQGVRCPRHLVLGEL